MSDIRVSTQCIWAPPVMVVLHYSGYLRQLHMYTIYLHLYCLVDTSSIHKIVVHGQPGQMSAPERRNPSSPLGRGYRWFPWGRGHGPVGRTHPLHWKGVESCQLDLHHWADRHTDMSMTQYGSIWLSMTHMTQYDTYDTWLNMTQYDTYGSVWLSTCMKEDGRGPLLVYITSLVHIPTHTSSIPGESTPSISFLWSSRNFRCIADICAISRSRRICALSLLDAAASCDGVGSSAWSSLRGAGKSSILGEPGPLSRHRLRYYDKEKEERSWWMQDSRTNARTTAGYMSIVHTVISVNYSIHSKLYSTHSKL